MFHMETPFEQRNYFVKTSYRVNSYGPLVLKPVAAKCQSCRDYTGY